MKSYSWPRHSVLGPALLLLAAAPARAAQPPAAAPGGITESRPGAFEFHLLPKAFQKDPRIDMTVITEMTDAGRQIPAPSADRPAYYVDHSSGYHDEGQGFTGQRPLPVELLQERLERSLLSSHYLKADRRHRPSVVLFYLWGSANTLDTDMNPDGTEGPANTPDIGHRNLLVRAALIGGQAFAHDYGKALERDDELKATGMHPIGLTAVKEFQNRDWLTYQLVEQAQDSCYYVVASAYDARALAHGQRILLWRTKMTTNSRGVSMADCLPELILAGGPYFGRDMDHATALNGRVVPLGSVKLGTPVVVPDATPVEPPRR